MNSKSHNTTSYWRRPIFMDVHCVRVFNYCSGQCGWYWPGITITLSRWHCPAVLAFCSQRTASSTRRRDCRILFTVCALTSTGFGFRFRNLETSSRSQEVHPGSQTSQEKLACLRLPDTVLNMRTSTMSRPGIRQAAWPERAAPFRTIADAWTCWPVRADTWSWVSYRAAPCLPGEGWRCWKDFGLLPPGCQATPLRSPPICRARRCHRCPNWRHYAYRRHRCRHRPRQPPSRRHSLCYWCEAGPHRCCSSFHVPGLLEPELSSPPDAASSSLVALSPACWVPQPG